MQAARLIGPGTMRIEQVNGPEVGPGDVLVRVEAAGICGSDRHMFRGEYPTALPVTLGHEFCGVVEAVGAEARRVKVGDRVTADPNIACGHCPACRSGRVNLCHNLQAIGVTRDGGTAKIALAYATEHLQVDPAPTLGEGPAGSYTLALALHPLVAGSVRAFVDDKEAGTYRVQAGQARTIYVSIPRKGQHQILVGLATQGDTYTTELSYRVDGGASLDKAFI